MAFIQKAFVLSTDHIPFRTGTVDCSKDFGISRACEHPSGYIVFVAPEQEPREVAEILLETPQWFSPLLMRAMKLHCHFIVFDDEAPAHKDFIVYPDNDDDTTEEFDEFEGTIEPLDEDTMALLADEADVEYELTPPIFD